MEIALCNDRETPTPIPVSMWMFQTKLRVDAGGAEVFLPVRDVLEQDWPEHDDEVRRLDLQYRNRLGVRDRPDLLGGLDGRARARGARPRCRRPGCRSPRRRRRRRGSVDGALLSMDALARATPDELRAGLAPLVSGYGAWLDEQEAQAADAARRTCARRPRWRCGRPARRTQRLADGLEHVATDAEALRCFQFMNRVMRDQRIASQVAALRASDAVGDDRRRRSAEVAERGRRRRRRGARSSWRSS